MKFKVLAYSFIVPVILLIILVIKQFQPTFFFDKYMVIGLLIGSLLRQFFNGRKFLVSLKINNEVTQVIFLSSIAKQKEFVIPTNQIIHFEYEKPNWITDNLDCLVLTDKKIWIRLELLTTQAKMEAKRQIDFYESLRKENVVTA